MIDVEQLRADMEAGTDGPWPLVTKSTSCGVAHLVGEWPSRGVHETSGACLYEDYPPTTPSGISETYANARRIARLPDLEQAYLDLHERERKLREALECLEVAATGAGVPHDTERRILHDCIRQARTALAEGGEG